MQYNIHMIRWYRIVQMKYIIILLTNVTPSSIKFFKIIQFYNSNRLRIKVGLLRFMFRFRNRFLFKLVKVFLTASVELLACEIMLELQVYYSYDVIRVRVIFRVKVSIIFLCLGLFILKVMVQVIAKVRIKFRFIILFRIRFGVRMNFEVSWI